MNPQSTIAKPVAPSVRSPAKPPAAPQGKRLLKLLGIGLGAVLVAVFSVIGAVQAIRSMTAAPVEPPVNAPIERIIAYVDTSHFRTLAFDRQMMWMKVLDERDDADEIKLAYKQRKLSFEEAANARTYAWFGKELTRMQNYFERRTAAERVAYLDKLLIKNPEPPKPPTTVKPGTPQPPAPVKADVSDIKVPRNQSWDKSYPLTWPAEVRSKWHEFDKAKDRREKELKAAGQAAIKAGLTRPGAVDPKSSDKGNTSKTPVGTSRPS